MLEALRDPKKRVVGLKQTLRALQQDRVTAVYLANDVDDHILRKVSTACDEHSVEMRSAGLGQGELGTLCQIEVGAAMVAILKS